MFKATMKILGMKASQGNFEGVEYDNTKVYVETAMDESKGTARGLTAAEYNFGTSKEFDKFKDVQFPFMADVSVSMTSTGKMQKMVITGIDPVKPQPKPVQASA